MTPEEHEELLRGSIRFALQMFKFRPPRTPNLDITDAYFNAAADAIIRHLKFAWAFEADGLRKLPPDEPHSDHDHYPDQWAEIMKKPAGKGGG